MVAVASRKVSNYGFKTSVVVIIISSSISIVILTGTNGVS